MVKKNMIIKLLFAMFLLTSLLNFILWDSGIFKFRTQSSLNTGDFSIVRISLMILLATLLVALDPGAFDKLLNKINILKLPNLIRDRKNRLLIYKSFGCAAATFSFFVFIATLILWAYDLIGG